MKYIFILLVIACVHVQAYAQTYQPILGKDSTQWNYVMYYDVEFSDIERVTTHIYKAYGDTVINSIAYVRMYENDYKENLYAYNLIGFIREDSEQGKVWFMAKDEPHEHLLFDFTLQLNDSVDVYFTDSLAKSRYCVIEKDDAKMVIRNNRGNYNTYIYGKGFY
ncbi:MAG TPA: hypothetical protein PLS12_08855, partial [Bacteroidales bacterium]|nr:hypothetical protein [Bacteroidales bacterium]